MKESPIFIKSFETLLWVAKRIEEAALSFQEELVLATKTDGSAATQSAASVFRRSW